MAGQTKVLCGVPDQYCTGGKYATDQQLPKKAHSSHESAFNCMTAYLVKMGFERLSAREFKDPQTGSVRVLTKQSRYGARLRPGKEGRWMPDDPMNRGTIVG